MEGRPAFDSKPRKEEIQRDQPLEQAGTCPHHANPPPNSLKEAREATWFCIETQEQFCGECAEKHRKSKLTRGHTLIDLRMCVNESRSVLSNLELEVMELIKDTETNAVRGKTLIEMIESRKARYRLSQEERLDRTIQALRA